MNTSETIKEISGALLKAGAEIDDPKRDGVNPQFKSKYITIDSVIDATRDPLSKNGIKVIQSPGMDEWGLFVCTRLIHAESGEWIEGKLSLPTPPNATPQNVGSAITYGRRYALLSMLNLGGEDDDGNAASAPAPKAAPVSAAFPGTVLDVIEKVDKVDRKNKAGKPFTLFSIKTANNGELNTFDEVIGNAALKAAGTGEAVSITAEPNGQYAPKCTRVAPANSTAPEDDLPF